MKDEFQYFLFLGFGFVLLTSCVAILVAVRGGERLGVSSYFDTQSDAITFEEFIQREFSSRTFNGSWWSDTELQWEDTVRGREWCDVN